MGIIRVRPGGESSVGRTAAVKVSGGKVSAVRVSVGVASCGKNSAPPGVVV